MSASRADSAPEMSRVALLVRLVGVSSGAVRLDLASLTFMALVFSVWFGSPAVEERLDLGRGCRSEPPLWHSAPGIHRAATAHSLPVVRRRGARSARSALPRHLLGLLVALDE